MAELDGVDFKHIAAVARERCAIWHPAGIHEWALERWTGAVSGEAGELAQAVAVFDSLSRLYNCGTVELCEAAWIDECLHPYLQDIAMELGDTYLYVNHTAEWLGFQLGDLVEQYRGAPPVLNWPKEVAYPFLDSTEQCSLVLGGLLVNARTGAVANLTKKLSRIETGAERDLRLNAEHLRNTIGHELRNVFVHLKWFAKLAQLNLADAVRDTFNRVSIREGFSQRL